MIFLDTESALLGGEPPGSVLVNEIRRVSSIPPQAKLPGPDGMWQCPALPLAQLSVSRRTLYSNDTNWIETRGSKKKKKKKEEEFLGLLNCKVLQ